MSSKPNPHNAVGAWFLGPRAENFQYLKDILNIVLGEQEKARKGYFPDDADYITSEMQASSEFTASINKLKTTIQELSVALARGSVPFWNPRYVGHMLMDTTMPSIAGYLAAMLFNPNNNAVEASPYTTYIEQEVGLDLSYMVGFNTNPKIKPMAWGHITCGGTVANLEAVWAARNLKFYPLSIRLAMWSGGPLEFIADTFKLETCTGESKLLKDFNTWELLNIIPEVALDIEERLHAQYRISTPWLRKVMEPYSIQNISRGADEFQMFGADLLNKMVMMTCATRHYSWPKAAAVLGIGAQNCLPITVDNNARMDMDDLRKHLDDCLRNRKAIYVVVGIMGSTEHGACDPLDKIVELRNEYRKKGLNFLIHADGAWGTYFASMIVRGTRGTPVVPSLALKPSTAEAMLALTHVDTVTVDPHKSGYIQYPAGGLLYRDGRLRHQISITSPIVFRDDAESMGVFGIEGSKPGAAAVATWVSNHVIGLNPQGYGRLLGEAIYSCTRFYCHIATMSSDDSDYIVVPLNMLPAEAEGKGVSSQKNYIRTRIIGVQNEKLVKDETAMKLLHDLGSDYAINAFAVNFRINGKVNEDVLEANDLNKRIFERLSVSDTEKDVNSVPLYLTSTQLGQKPYGNCLTTFKNRLGLKGDEDLYTLVNVVSSPFPTTDGFTRDLAWELEKVIQEEVAESIRRNSNTPHLHGFIMQGTDQIHYVHLPVFGNERHRRQLVITGELPADVKAKYLEEKAKNPNQYFTLGTNEHITLDDMLTRGHIQAFLVHWRTFEYVAQGFQFTNIKIVVDKSLHKQDLRLEYPRFSMPFYLYGTKDQLHIDHALLVNPNIMLSGEQVKLDGPPLPSLQYPAALHFRNLAEHAMHPFPKNKVIKADKDFFFRTGETFDVFINNNVEDNKTELWAGKLTLRGVFIDVDELNDVSIVKAKIRYQAVPGATDTVNQTFSATPNTRGIGQEPSCHSGDTPCFLGQSIKPGQQVNDRPGYLNNLDSIKKKIASAGQIGGGGDEEVVEED